MSALNAPNPTPTNTEPALLRTLRSARNLLKEAHPYERHTAILRPHPVAWEFYTAKLARTVKFYVPAAVLVFGWPFAMKWMVNGWNGVYDTPRGRGRRD